MKFTRHFYPLFLLFIMQLFNACTPDDYEVFGKQPIYSNGDSLYVIQNIDTQLIVNAGNIYSWNQYLFINEVYKGIHVIDKSDSSNPVKLTFIKIIGNRNFTISDNTLLADNGKDLIAIDISDALQLLRLSDALQILLPRDDALQPLLPRDDALQLLLPRDDALQLLLLRD